MKILFNNVFRKVNVCLGLNPIHEFVLMLYDYVCDREAVMGWGEMYFRNVESSFQLVMLF